jgi:DMSO/TMAO reductase YedYZ molybdopterin-dependent catalytic subunit
MVGTDDSSLSLRHFFAYGLFGGLVATIGAYIGTVLLGLPYPPEEILQLMIALVPGSIQSVAVETLQEYAKYGAFVFAAALYSTFYGFVGVLVGFVSRKNFQKKIGQSIIISTTVTTLIGLGLAAPLATTVSILSTTIGWMMDVALLVIVNLGYAGIFVYLARSELAGAERVPTQELELAASRSRRGFLKKAVIAAAVVIVAGVVSRIVPAIFSGQPLVRSGTSIRVNPQSEDVDSDLPPIFRDSRITDLVGSEVTDNRVFYRVDINAIPPQLDFDKWSLKISGKVSNPTIFTKSSFLALPTKDEYATLECVSNTINPPGGLISDAKWTGVPLATILNQAGLTSDAKFVVFRCADGYTVGIPLERAMQPGALLVYKMNDQALPTEHGFPLRAMVPGVYGMMNAKWITEIEAMDHVYLGYWQDRGWSNDAKIKTTSIIYYPPSQVQGNGPLPIAGTAFAGDRGISKVEVSTDGGNTWNPAILKKPRSPCSWILWAYEWTPAQKGNYTVMVRATDGNGQPQESNSVQPFPDGASGYHSVQVTVT